MAYQEENLDYLPEVSEEDSLLRPGQLSEKDEQYLSSYNRLIDKGFLSALTQSEYKVWRLFANTQITIKEISNELGLSQSMVRKYIKQVTNKLKEELEVEHNWNRPIEQKYTRTGFKKNLKTKLIKSSTNTDAEKTDRLFKNRIKEHQKEVDDFLRRNPLVKRQFEDEDYEDQ
jgi:predicted transcriptional regulator